LAGPNANVDINSTVATTNWISEGLHYLLPSHVQPNMRKLGLAGHSRGGKAAFALVVEKAATSLKFSALIGIDPVDGICRGLQTPPPVLTYVPHSFDLDMPAMVIGTELGEMGKNILCCITLPAPAPKGVNHEDFFNECQKPACHFFVKGYGHVDMLDDDIGLMGIALNMICSHGNSRKPMRRFVGGVAVAFMKAHLLGDDSDLMAIRDGQQTAPVELKSIEFLE
jgi:chlorophyllase